MSCKLHDPTNVSKNVRRLTSDKRKIEGPIQLASFITILKFSNSVKLLKFSSQSWDTHLSWQDKKKHSEFCHLNFHISPPHPSRRGSKQSDKLKKKKKVTLFFYSKVVVINPFSSDHMHFTCVAASHKFSVPLTRRLLAHGFWQYARVQTKPGQLQLGAPPLHSLRLKPTSVSHAQYWTFKVLHTQTPTATCYLTPLRANQLQYFTFSSSTEGVTVIRKTF